MIANFDRLRLQYSINFTAIGTYHVRLRGYVPNGAGDSIFVGIDEEDADILTGFTPRDWSWANANASGNRVKFEVTTPGHHLLRFWQREDGIRLDRILLTIDSEYNPNVVGP